MKAKQGLLCVAAALLAAGSMAVQAQQNYPTKPVRWIVPFPPGGGTDLISRTIAAKLTDAWHVQVIADNRPGSGGVVGLNVAAKSAPDGYTIVLAQASNAAVAPSLYKKIPYDPLKELAPVTLVITSPTVLVAHPSFPAKDLKQFIAYARSKPGLVTYGSPGNGTMGHLSLEMLKTMAKIDMLHIPYKGASLALTELIGGQIVLYSSSMPPAVPLISSGRLRALAVTSSKRVGPLPDVPTVAEAAVPGYEAVNWYGVMAPAGTPKEILAKLNTDIVRILKQPDVKDRFASEGGDIIANTPDEFGAFIRNEIPKWAKVIREAKVTVD